MNSNIRTQVADNREMTQRVKQTGEVAEDGEGEPQNTRPPPASTFKHRVKHHVCKKTTTFIGLASPPPLAKHSGPRFHVTMITVLK